MAKFKVGDIVRVRNDLVVKKEYDSGCLFTPDMKRYLGQVVKIKSIVDTNFLSSSIDRYEVDESGWKFSNSMLEPAHPDQQIHISRDGDTVHAILKEHGKVVKRTKAVCAPSDTFDFELGARIAFDRLFEKETKKEKVFCLEAYLRDRFNESCLDFAVESLKNGWPIECDGKTEAEMAKMDKYTSESWMVEP